MTKTWIVLALAALMAQAGFGKTVGVLRAGRDVITPGMLKTMESAGWVCTNVSKGDLENANKLAAVDVLLFTGGWNDYFFPSYEARRTLHAYVAGGKGILSSGFRSGYSRTASRPLFPQVGATHNRGNGALIVGSGDSVLAKAIKAPFSAGGWDHMTLAVGPEGKVFATCAGDPVGAFGEIYGGRYIALGAFIGGNAPSNGMTGVERDVFMAMLDWLNGAPKRNAGAIAQARAQADLDFLRRERGWDWTFDARGHEAGPGIVPTAHHTIAGMLESRLYQLEYMSSFFDRTPGAAASVIADLKAGIADLDAATKRKTAEVEAKIKGMSVVDLDAWKTDRAKQLPEIQASLFPADRLTGLKAKADQAIAQLRPQANAVKADRLAKERKADEAKIPDLAKKLAEGNVEARRQAATELGRIGSLKGAPALIAALKDADEAVRVNAILGLGWMQAREAFPALIDLAKGKDLRMKRRAAQALGQIGDARAIPVLLALLKESDVFTVDNAIFSLGWLKAKEAVPELVRIATTLDRGNGDQRGWMIAAVRALGAIGDEAAIPALEKVAQVEDDMPLGSARNAKSILNIYSTAQSIGFKLYAEMAIADIRNAAKRARPAGVVQPAFLASADRFYALTKRFNALAGRPGTGTALFQDEPLAYLAYLKEAGMTGLHMAWGEQNADPDAYFKQIQACGDLDLIVVDTWPFDGNAFGNKKTVRASRQSSLEKAAGDLLAERYQAEPAFAGLWSEEVYPWAEISMAEFESWYKRAYGDDPRKRFDYAGEAAFAAKSKTFEAEMAECRADKILAYWRESQDFMNGVRKSCALTFSISHRSIADHAGMSAFAGDAIHVNGPEIYQCFGRDNAYLMESFKDGRARPVMCEFYNWYTPSPAHAVRGFAQHLMHGECFYNFHLAHIFKYSGGGYNWTWDSARWPDARRIFQKARKIREYLEVPESGANVAQLCSERTSSQFKSGSPMGFRWYQQQAALWTALGQSQIPADVIWAESLSAEKLARYRVIVTLDSKLLNDPQTALLRDWVKQGGVLIAGGTVSLFDQAEQVRADYGLADVFGVAYAGFGGVTDPARNDTLMFTVDKPPLPVESTMRLPTVANHVHREVKPVSSIGVYTVKKADALPGMAVGAACEYDMPLGYDKVKPAAGTEVLATFANGDPAITLSRVGQGACYFWTPIYPALCYVGSEFENDANRKDFWPNVREALAAMVKGGLAHAQATLPVDVIGVSKEVEVTVRGQPERNRTMVHVLDYDTKSAGVKGAGITIHPPAGKTVKRVFYPDTDTAVPFAAAEGGVTAKLRDFDVHDMVVIEWEAAK